MPFNATTTAVVATTTACPQTVAQTDTEGFFVTGAGTFVGVTGTVQGSYDGTSWFNMLAYSPASGAVTAGGTTITLTDSTGGQFFRIPNVQGLNSIRFKANGWTSGSCPLTVGSGYFGNASPSALLSLSGSGAVSSSVPTYTVAALGTNQATGAAILPGATWVTGADATKGVTLALTAGAVFFIKNDDTANAVLKVYGGVGAGINAVAAGTAYSMAAKTSGIFWNYSSTQVFSIPLVQS